VKPPTALKTLVALFALASATAFAHGVYPQTLHVQTGPAGEVVVGTSFGLIVQRGEGEWRWICDEAIGDTSGQPSAIHAAADGRYWVASSKGLFASTDQGCGWSAIATFTESGASDITGIGATLYATTSRFGQVNRVYRSTDSGATFTPTALASDAKFFGGIRLAPSRPQRLYVSAWWYTPTVSSFLHVSDDSGATFDDRDLSAALPAAGAFRVHAVHPTNPDVLFASVEDVAVADKVYLVKSVDAGATFTAVLAVPRPFTSVAISADGNVVYAATAILLYRSTDGGQTFTALDSPTRNACVTLSGSDVYACGWPLQDGWALGRSDNGGASFTSALEWKDLQGPLSCAEGTPVFDLCEPIWPTVRGELGIPIVVGEDGGQDPAPTPRGCGCSSLEGGAFLAWAAAAIAVRRRRSTVRLTTTTVRTERREAATRPSAEAPDRSARA
jgi:hypothetical protein